MELSPSLYHWLVRPKWFSDMYIGNILKSNFNFENKTVLDFGSGVGSSCFLLSPSGYMGVDCDSKRISYAKLLYPDYNFQMLQGDKIPADDNSIDYVLIISVLHHISSEAMDNYIKELYRVIKKNGRVIVIEPCFFEKSHVRNRFMSFFDKGSYIRDEHEYIDMFSSCFQTDVHSKYSQLLLYNKIFFTAAPV
ncbi:MAG: putative methyltransferase type 11 [Clostridia bacterium]|nr:putative methyltransferase type 11 [Clostridia bacterium]